MRALLAAAVVAAATLVGPASAGVPATLGAVSFSPLPKVGTTTFFVVTVTGKVTVRAPAPLYLFLTNPNVLTRNAGAVAAEARPTVKAGTAKAVIYVALFNSSKPLRRVAASDGGDALSGIVQATRDAWGEAKVTEKEIPCKDAALDLHIAHIVWGNFWLAHSIAGLTADEWMQRAEKNAKGC